MELHCLMVVIWRGTTAWSSSALAKDITGIKLIMDKLKFVSSKINITRTAYDLVTFFKFDVQVHGSVYFFVSN